MNSSPSISLSAIPPAKNYQALHLTAKVVSLPGAALLPVINVKRRGRLPHGVIPFVKHQRRRHDLLAGLARRQELQALREKLHASSDMQKAVRIRMAELDATAEEFVFILER